MGGTTDRNTNSEGFKTRNRDDANTHPTEAGISGVLAPASIPEEKIGALLGTYTEVWGPNSLKPLRAHEGSEGGGGTLVQLPGMMPRSQKQACDSCWVTASGVRGVSAASPHLAQVAESMPPPSFMMRCRSQVPPEATHTIVSASWWPFFRPFEHAQEVAEGHVVCPLLEALAAEMAGGASPQSSSDGLLELIN
eukprot:9503461-Pyramimonas_sp.AAC.2